MWKIRYCDSTDHHWIQPIFHSFLHSFYFMPFVDRITTPKVGRLRSLGTWDHNSYNRNETNCIYKNQQIISTDFAYEQPL